MYNTRTRGMAGLRLDLGKIDKDLLVANEEEDSTDNDHQNMDPLSNDYHLDSQLTPFEKLEKYFQSEELMERDIAVRNIIDACYFVTNYTDFELILDIVCTMASDHDPLIRIGVLNTVISLLERNTEFREEGDTPFGQENEDRLYEIPVKMLNDFNQQVRRVSHNSVVTLLDEPHAPIDSLLNQLSPMIKKCLGREENYDLRMDTVLLIGRVAPFFGQQSCISIFVPLLHPLASDTMFHVRKAFATCCKDLCPSVGEECTEGHILPYFLQLCKDEVWGVRKACAEVFMDVSIACSLLARQERLTPVFLHLLKDDSRWVRKAAFQTLGPFISTFYVGNHEESVSSLEPLSDAELLDTSLLGGKSSDFNDSVFLANNGSKQSDTKDKEFQTPSKGSGSPSHAVSPLMIFQTPPHVLSSLSSSILDSEVPQDEYGLFQFWRSPILTVFNDELEPDSCSSENQTGSKVVYSNTTNHNGSLSSDLTCQTGFSSSADDGLKRDLFGSTREDEILKQYEIEDQKDDEEQDGLMDIKDELLAESEGMEKNDIERNKDLITDINKLTLLDSPVGSTANGFPHVRVFVQNTTGQIHEEDVTSGRGYIAQSTPFHQHDTTAKSVAMEMTLMESAVSEPFFVTNTNQEIVPDELIDMYLSMIDPVKTQSIDADLPLYCAFSFPAVLQTLGPRHWPLLKPTFDSLASDMQWKIRRILAHCIHEIARMLGQERTVAELVTIVDEYSTKDLDDIKLGILSHLAQFFEILPMDVRRNRFPSILLGLLDTENEKNWRYRDLLAEQLILLCDLYDCPFIEEHITPVAIKLGHDRVAQVRDTSSRLISIILHKLEHSHPSSCPVLLKQLKESFAFSDRWLLRLMYIKQCELFLHERRLSYSLFATDCLPTLISLSSNNVPNVRLAVGRLLYRTISNIEFFSSNYSLSSTIQTILKVLQNDTDRDVRYFSGAPLDPPPMKSRSDPSPSTKRTRSVSEGDSANDGYKFDIARAAGLLHLT